MHPRAAPRDRLRGLRAAADQVLAVIHHDQHILRGEGIQQSLQRRQAWLPSKPQRPGDGRRHRVLVGDRGQLRQPRPVPGPIQQLGRHLQPQPGLPAPPGPGQSDQARRLHQGPDLGHLPVPADERRQLGGQVIRQRRVIQRPQRRESRLQARRVQLEDPLRAAQVLQPVHPQIGQRRARRQPAADQRGRRLRDQHLTPVGRRGHPGGPVHLQAHQARRRPRRFPAMDAHPHPDPLPARPGMVLDGLLHRQHRRHAGPRRGEHGEERVPLRVHLAAAVGGQRRPDQRVMPGAYSDESDHSVRGFRTPAVGGRVAADAGVLSPLGHLLLGHLVRSLPPHSGFVLFSLLLVFIERQFTSFPGVRWYLGSRRSRTRRAPGGAGWACPLFLPGGPPEAQRSRPGLACPCARQPGGPRLPWGHSRP